MQLCAPSQWPARHCCKRRNHTRLSLDRELVSVNWQLGVEQATGVDYRCCDHLYTYNSNTSHTQHMSYATHVIRNTRHTQYTSYATHVVRICLETCHARICTCTYLMENENKTEPLFLGALWRCCSWFGSTVGKGAGEVGGVEAGRGWKFWW